jgi:hypothetical protein
VPVPNDSFFETVDFKGACSGANNDWTQGWTFAVH